MLIATVQDISDALGKGFEEGGLLLEEEHFAPQFYDLKTGLAGELFQKFVNYPLPLAIVIERPERYGKRFAELAGEHRRHPMVRTFFDLESATKWLDAMRSAG